MNKKRIKNAFPKQSRLLKSVSFQSVFSHPLSLYSAPYRFYAKPNALPFARLGVVVGKKHLPKAVLRNQVKRILRESFRQHQALLSGLDIVVLACRSIIKILGSEQQDSHQRQKICKQQLEPKWSELLNVWDANGSQP